MLLFSHILKLCYFCAMQKCIFSRVHILVKQFSKTNIQKCIFKYKCSLPEKKPKACYIYHNNSSVCEMFIAINLFSRWYLRNNYIVFEELLVPIGNLWWNMQFYLGCTRKPVKQDICNCHSQIDTSKSLDIILLFLF